MCSTRKTLLNIIIIHNWRAGLGRFFYNYITFYGAVRYRKMFYVILNVLRDSINLRSYSETESSGSTYIALPSQARSDGF